MISITTTYLETSFCLKGEGGVGTAFGLSHEGENWLVTAKHNLKAAGIGNKVFLRRECGWEPFEIKEIRVHATQDVSAMKLAGLNFSPPAESPVGADNWDIEIGGQLKFLGFPHGLHNTYNSPLGFNTPLVRTAHFSGVISSPTGNLLVLDGFNNPGYSGAPVWYAGRTKSQLHLLGVVSGYRVEERSKSNVFRDHGDGKETPETGLFVKPNSGMIHAVPTADLISII